MQRHFRILVACCVLIIAALLVVGAVSHGVLRHIVQTSPLWIAIFLATRHSAFTKWTALPCFLFWLLVMIAIWLFLLGWARIVSGTFSPTEIAMTLIVGSAAAIGIAIAGRLRTAVRAWSAILTFLLVAALQLLAFRLSLLPPLHIDRNDSPTAFQNFPLMGLRHRVRAGTYFSDFPVYQDFEWSHSQRIVRQLYLKRPANRQWQANATVS